MAGGERRLWMMVRRRMAVVSLPAVMLEVVHAVRALGGGIRFSRARGGGAAPHDCMEGWIRVMSYQGGMDLSLACASRKRERKSRELVEDTLSSEESGALLRSAMRASPNAAMGLMRTVFKRWKMGFLAQRPSTQGICMTYVATFLSVRGSSKKKRSRSQ